MVDHFTRFTYLRYDVTLTVILYGGGGLFSTIWRRKITFRHFFIAHTHKQEKLISWTTKFSKFEKNKLYIFVFSFCFYLYMQEKLILLCFFFNLFFFQNERKYHCFWYFLCLHMWEKLICWAWIFFSILIYYFPFVSIHMWEKLIRLTSSKLKGNPIISINMSEKLISCGCREE